MLTLQSPKLSLSDLPARVETAITQLHEIEQNQSTYMDQFVTYMENCSYPLIGDETEINVHVSIIVPYINAILKNIECRFGDNMKNMSIASNIFDPSNKTDLSRDELDDQLATLCHAFNLPHEVARAEWA